MTKEYKINENALDPKKDLFVVKITKLHHYGVFGVNPITFWET